MSELNFFQKMNSPLGELYISADDTAVTQVAFEEGKADVPIDRENDITNQCIEELGRYFSGDLKVFAVACRPKGTVFQQAVWKALTSIPYGRTVSYMYIAERVADKQSVRAVGTANGVNPLPILIPCHRIVGSNGDLTGYSGQLWRKEWLLSFEKGGVQQSLF